MLLLLDADHLEQQNMRVGSTAELGEFIMKTWL